MIKKKITTMSRAKFENISFITLNLLNIAIFLMVFVASILKSKDGTMANIIQSIYCTIMSVFLILHEFASPLWTQVYFGFLNIHRGKSLVMLFLGCLVMCDISFNIIVSILSFTMGFAYFILSLVSTIPPPNSFLIHWQNYKDFWAEGLDLPVPPMIDTKLTRPRVIVTSTHENILNNKYPHPSAWRPSSSRMTGITVMSETSNGSPVRNPEFLKFQRNMIKQDDPFLRLY